MVPVTVVLVTGSTDDVGRIAAERFAAMGASVILHGKDPYRVARTLDALRSRRPESRRDSITADLRDPQAIGKLASMCSSTTQACSCGNGS
jgi:NAD(P)-dependent dehydrogenase (short-subunit alcohol dehydrogenase family)